MTNPVLQIRTTSRHGDGPDGPRWLMAWMWCPGCDSAKAIPVVRPGDNLPPTGPYWDWDGNLESPTFGPSILQHQGEQMPLCHSYVIAGRWQFLVDSTHALAGQTVDMVPLPDWLVQD